MHQEIFPQKVMLSDIFHRHMVSVLPTVILLVIHLTNQDDKLHHTHLHLTRFGLMLSGFSGIFNVAMPGASTHKVHSSSSKLGAIRVIRGSLIWSRHDPFSWTTIHTLKAKSMEFLFNAVSSRDKDLWINNHNVRTFGFMAHTSDIFEMQSLNGGPSWV